MLSRRGTPFSPPLAAFKPVLLVLNRPSALVVVVTGADRDETVREVLACAPWARVEVAPLTDFGQLPETAIAGFVLGDPRQLDFAGQAALALRRCAGLSIIGVRASAPDFRELLGLSRRAGACVIAAHEDSPRGLAGIVREWGWPLLTPGWIGFDSRDLLHLTRAPCAGLQYRWNSRSNAARTYPAFGQLKAAHLACFCRPEDSTAALSELHALISSQLPETADFIFSANAGEFSEALFTAFM